MLHVPFIKNSNQKGFTLIELLVVLGILGILAAALLAAINPVEQLKKANDASQQELASQYVSADVRYYTTNNAHPWSVSGGCNGTNTTFTGSTLTALAACTTAYVTAGELKGSFSSANSLSSTYVTNPNPVTGSASDIIVCFQPQSRSVQSNANTKYTTNAGSTTGNSSCISQGGATACYWCAQ